MSSQLYKKSKNTYSTTIEGGAKNSHAKIDREQTRAYRAKQDPRSRASASKSQRETARDNQEPEQSQARPKIKNIAKQDPRSRAKKPERAV